MEFCGKSQYIGQKSTTFPKSIIQIRQTIEAKIAEQLNIKTIWKNPQTNLIVKYQLIAI